jgi:hypothetical protein
MSASTHLAHETYLADEIYLADRARLIDAYHVCRDIAVLANIAIVDHDLSRLRWEELRCLIAEGALSELEREYVWRVLKLGDGYPDVAGGYHDVSIDFGLASIMATPHNEYYLAAACVASLPIDLTPWLLQSSEKGRVRARVVSRRARTSSGQGPYIRLKLTSDERRALLDGTDSPIVRLFSILFESEFPLHEQSSCDGTKRGLPLVLPTFWTYFLTRDSIDRLIVGCAGRTPHWPSFFTLSLAILVRGRDIEYQTDFYERAAPLLISSGLRVPGLGGLELAKELYSFYMSGLLYPHENITAELVVELHHRRPLSQDSIKALAHKIVYEDTDARSLELFASIGLDPEGMIGYIPYGNKSIAVIKWLWDRGYRPSNATVATLLVRGCHDSDERLRLLAELEGAGIVPVVPDSLTDLRGIDPRYLIESTDNLQQRLIDMGQLAGEKSEEEDLVKPAASRTRPD